MFFFFSSSAVTSDTHILQQSSTLSIYTLSGILLTITVSFASAVVDQAIVPDSFLHRITYIYPVSRLQRNAELVTTLSIISVFYIPIILGFSRDSQHTKVLVHLLRAFLEKLRDSNSTIPTRLRPLSASSVR